MQFFEFNRESAAGSGGAGLDLDRKPQAEMLA